MKITLNREYAMRHLFTTVLMLGLGGWFGYDGFVGYPATPAADLYRSIEGSDAPAGLDLEAFKRQKIQTQYGFMILTLLAAIVIGGHVWMLSGFRFEFDDESYTFAGKRVAIKDVKSVDRSQWEKKGIVKLDGIKLDAWHHAGVKEFVAKLGSV